MAFLGCGSSSPLDWAGDIMAYEWLIRVFQAVDQTGIRYEMAYNYIQTYMPPLVCMFVQPSRLGEWMVDGGGAASPSVFQTTSLITALGQSEPGSFHG